MVQDLREAVADDLDVSTETAVEKAESTLWQAKAATFEAHYNKDITLLKRAISGHGVLQDKFFGVDIMLSSVKLKIV